MVSLVDTPAGVDIATGSQGQDLRCLHRQQNLVSLPNYVKTCAGFQGLPRPTTNSPSNARRPPQHPTAQEETVHASGNPDLYTADTMRRLRHEAATVLEQLEFYRAQHPTTLIPDDLPPIEEDKEDTE